MQMLKSLDSQALSLLDTTANDLKKSYQGSISHSRFGSYALVHKCFGREGYSVCLVFLLWSRVANYFDSPCSQNSKHSRPQLAGSLHYEKKLTPLRFTKSKDQTGVWSLLFVPRTGLEHYMFSIPFGYFTFASLIKYLKRFSSPLTNSLFIRRRFVTRYAPNNLLPCLVCFGIVRAET
jgi:hypothetical protein